MRWRPATLILPALLLLSVLQPPAESLPTPFLSPRVQWVYPEVEVVTYPVRDLAGNLIGERSWRIVEGTGNCCENYVASTPTGRVYDAGSEALLFSDDEGRTWRRVSTTLSVSGEGAVVVAPDGKVYAGLWDTYGGDRLTALRYDPATNTWSSSVVALHRPLFDRPWMTIAPGPFVQGSITYPYAIILAPLIAAGTMVSFDGLTYLPLDRVSAMPFSTDAVDVALEPAPFQQPARAWADVVQPPLTVSRLTPLPSGGLLETAGCPWQLMDGDLTWTCVQQRGPVDMYDALRFDSLGRPHHLMWNLSPDHLRYEWSLDGGATWRTLHVPVRGWLDLNGNLEFIVDGQSDVAHIALEVDRGPTKAYRVLRIAGLSEQTQSIEVMDVGLGDGDGRLDFLTIAALPGGRVVTSFVDSQRGKPALAFELPS